MSSIRLIMVESDNCNPLICCLIASLLSKSAKNISAEAKKQSLTISESERVFFPKPKSQDASVKRSAVEVVLCMSLCCSEREEESCSSFFSYFTSRWFTFVELWVRCLEMLLQITSLETRAGLFA